MAIPVLDAEYDGHIRWAEALRPHAELTRKVLLFFNREGRKLAKWEIVLEGVKTLISGLNYLLGSMFREEAGEIARVADVPVADVLTLNVVYDLFTINPGYWACSTFICETSDGPILARNLDWEGSPGILRSSTVIVRVHGAPGGEYRLVTWPGLFGALTAVAPRRFSLAVNFVQHRTASSIANTVGRAIAGYLPATWATRVALDTRRTYTSAVSYLSSVPLLAPVMISVAGKNRGEGVVIERAPAECKRRKLGPANFVCVTNHYVSEKFRDQNVDSENSDSEARYVFLMRKLQETRIERAEQCCKILSSKSLLGKFTHHQVVARARDAMLAVRLPGARVQVSV